MKPDSMAQTTRDVASAFLRTFLYLALLPFDFDFLIPEKSSLGTRLRRPVDEKDID
jgi:hypothetical protein